MLNFSGSLYQLIAEHTGDSKVAAALMNSFRITNEFGDYLAMRAGQITYLPAGRKHLQNDDGTWRQDNRQEGRPAKIIRRFIVAEYADTWLTDKDFEVFANLIKSQDISNIGEFALVEGEDIRRWYDGHRYARNSGSLYTSCMRYENCQPYFDLYVNNPDVCKMLILHKHNILYGRALVWTLADGSTYMDRIYGSDMVVEGFKEYARERGWMHRYYNAYHHETMIVRNGKVEQFIMTLNLKNYQYRYYPYMDTLKFIHPYKGTISNRQTNGTHTIANQHGEAQPPINWNRINNPQPVPRNDIGEAAPGVIRNYIENLAPVGQFRYQRDFEDGGTVYRVYNQYDELVYQIAENEIVNAQQAQHDLRVNNLREAVANNG